MSENSEIVPVEVHESEITVQNSCVSLVSDLRTQGASVYLPEKKILKPATEEYREIFLNSVPPDMAEDIGAILKQRHKHLSFLGGCIIAVFLLATVVMLYFLFPEPLGKEVSYEVKRQSGTVAKGFSRVCAEAEKLYGEKNFAAVITMLESTVKDICADGKSIRENDRLLGVFFDAVRMCPPDNEKTEEYKKLIKSMRKADPGRFSWYLDEIYLEFPESRPDYYNHISPLPVGDEEGVLAAAKKRNKENYDRMATKMQEMEREHKEKWINSLEYQENRELYELIAAQMYVCQWIYHSQGYGMSHDEGNEGVIAREKAWEILKKEASNQNTKNTINTTFLDLKIFLLKKINDSGIGILEWNYYFDGENRWGSKYLTDILDTAKDPLKN